MPNRSSSTKNLILANRNQRLYRYHLAHPNMTLRALGGIFHLSFQRIDQIIKREEAKCQ